MTRLIHLLLPALASAALAGEGAGLAFPRIDYLGDDIRPVYVECHSTPNAGADRPTVVFVHGAAHTGAIYVATPDGRPGLLPWFVAAGFPACTLDLPGRGRSAALPGVALSGLDTAARALLELVQREGSVVLVGHSMGARVIQHLVADTEAHAAIRAVMLLAPVGPAELTGPPPPGFPVRGQQPFVFDREAATQFFVFSGEAPAAAFPIGHLDNYLRSLHPESPLAVNEFTVPDFAPALGPRLFEGVPMLLVGAEGDNAVPVERLGEAAAFWGVPLVLLGRDWGLSGNGHLFPVELNNADIAARLLEWLDEVLSGPEDAG